MNKRWALVCLALDAHLVFRFSATAFLHPISDIITEAAPMTLAVGVGGQRSGFPRSAGLSTGFDVSDMRLAVVPARGVEQSVTFIG